MSSSQLLAVWERGSRLHSLDQALTILETALPGTPYEALADWPMGRRNVALAKFRCMMFGPDLEAWIACPRCTEKLEFQMDSRTITAPEEQTSNQSISVRGHRFRLPSSRDLARVYAEGDAATAAVRLLESCCLDTQEPTVWSEVDVEEVGERMASADTMAETRLTFSCPKCGFEWEESLDIVQFLWTEIDATARRVLREVHALAGAYGWSEAEILSLSDTRRNCYLEMVQQ